MTFIFNTPFGEVTIEADHIQDALDASCLASEILTQSKADYLSRAQGTDETFDSMIGGDL
jgi:hypothetical protein